MVNLGIFTIALLFAGCGDIKPRDGREENIVENTKMQSEESSTMQEHKTIYPLPITIDMNCLDNCTVAVSFEEGDTYVDDMGVMQLDVTVYTYDVYDMVDTSDLEVGEKIFYPGDFLIERGRIRYDFHANNTTVVIEKGQMIKMKRIYRP